MLMKFRSNRATYWVSLATLLAVTFAFKTIAHKPFAVSEALVALVCIPRLHDIGKSGWIAAAFLALEFLLLFVSSVNLLVMGVYVVAMAGLLVWLGCIRGQAGPNKWGEVPEPGVQWKARRRMA